MISIEKLRAVRQIISHASCPDGTASALILKDALPDVKVSFMSYNTEVLSKLPAEPGLLFVDFTPPRDRVQEFVAVGSAVLDHHPTARDIVEAFGENGIFGLNEKNECGAWLAYKHVWEQVVPEKVWGEGNKFSFKWELRDRVREFARLAAIRDTWKNADPDFEEASRQASMLTFLPQRLRSEMSLPDALAFCKDEKLAAIIRERQLDSAHSGLRESASFTTSKGTRGIMFQGVAATSDAAEILEQQHVTRGPRGELYLVARKPMADLVVGFHYRRETCGSCGGGGDNDPSGAQGEDPLCPTCRGAGGKLQLQFSMRSHTGYDVSAFAKHHGGGGHKAAAGFTVEVSPELSANPYAVFRLLLEQWEGR